MEARTRHLNQIREVLLKCYYPPCPVSENERIERINKIIEKLEL